MYWKITTLENLTEVIDGITYTEKWKPIIEYGGVYEVSNFGRIKSLGNFSKKRKVIIRKQHIGDVGYPSVTLIKKGIHKTVRVHRLVGMYFIENKMNKRQINHKKGIKTDNRFHQLEWVTAKEDSIHAFKNGLLKIPSTSWNKGWENANSKAVNQYSLDCKFIKRYSSISEAKRITGAKNIGVACKGNQINSGGFQWRYIGDAAPAKKINRFISGDKHHKSKSVYQISKNNKVIKKWVNARQASIKLGILVQSIGKACKKTIKTAGGYKWEFA